MLDVRVSGNLTMGDKNGLDSRIKKPTANTGTACKVGIDTLSWA